ncbi:hypothetical protein C367_06460, partial [Cryptococcus neoformans Ze90-1]
VVPLSKVKSGSNVWIDKTTSRKVGSAMADTTLLPFFVV